MKNFAKGFLTVLALTVLLAGCGKADEQQTSAERPLSLGQVSEGVYTNEYMNLAFAPEGWTILNSDQLQGALEGAAQLVEGTSFEEQVQGMDQIMVMEALAPDGVTNTNVVYTAMDSSEKLAHLSMSDEEALDAVLTKKEDMVSAYAAAGVQIGSLEKIPVSYRGEERMGLRILGSVENIPMCMIQIYERMLGDYSAVVTVTALSEEEAMHILGFYQKLNS